MPSFAFSRAARDAASLIRLQRLFLAAGWAILLQLPLAALAADRSAEALSLPCNGCHGPDGVSQGESLPSIAGLSADYMLEAMIQFKEGRRSATIMNRISKGYKNYELRKMAGYFASKEWRTVPTNQEQRLVSRGRQLHQAHCAECHEDMGRYQDKEVPRLAGQRPKYLLMQLTLYKRGEEKLPQPTDMADRLAEVAEEDLPALSAFYATVQ